MRHFIRHADTLVKCRMRVNSLADVNKTNKFSPEVRKRAVRLVSENRGEYPSQWAAVESIAAKIGCVSQTLLEWFKREKVDGGQRDGLTSSERERIKALKREVKDSEAGWPFFLPMRSLMDPSALTPENL